MISFSGFYLIQLKTVTFKMANNITFSEFQEVLPNNDKLLSSLESSIIQDGVSYSSKMSQEMSTINIVLNVISAFHLLVVIPSNVFTLVVIAKTKCLWTPSNIVLGVNGFFMTIGSTMMLVLRLGGFPLLLFDESQRVVVYAMAWWVYALTMRIGNNR